MKLIMNADDFGYSRAINWGILDAYKNGIVRSTTLMPNMPGFNHAAELASNHSGLGIGVHLVLTCGKPLNGISKTLTDENGNFLKLSELLKRVSAKEIQIDLQEVENEYKMQIEKVFDAGIMPTHLDSHHHTHMLPGIIDIFYKTAEKYSLPVRITAKKDLPLKYTSIKTTEFFRQDFFGDTADAEYLIKILNEYKESTDTIEIMCHPAYLDYEILNGSSYNFARTKELIVLCSSEIALYIKNNNIELVNFRDI